MVETNLDGMLS